MKTIAIVGTGSDAIRAKAEAEALLKGKSV